MRAACHECRRREQSVSRDEIGLRHHPRMHNASPASDFRLYHGNSLEVLAGLMAETLREPAPGAGLLAADTILIPQVSMRRWLQNLLAQTHGIAANLNFLTPGEFVREALAANLPGTEDVGSLDAANARAAAERPRDNASARLRSSAERYALRELMARPSGSRTIG